MRTYKIYGLAGQFRVIDENSNRVAVCETLEQAKVICMQAGATIEMINCRQQSC